VPRSDGDAVVVEVGPWMPRVPACHLLPSLALLASPSPSVRFEVSARRGTTWSSWVATMALGDDTGFAPMPSAADGLLVDVDEISATPPVDALRLRIRVRGPGADAMRTAPWLASVSAWEGSRPGATSSTSAVRLAVPSRTQMTEREDVRLRICSPTSVGMALAFHGRDVPTMALADEIFHRATDRYGVWPAAVRAAAAHGVPGYLLRFPDWDTVAWCLGRGLPIVASIRYAAGELTDAPMPDTTGHLVVITGMEGDAVLVNDPAAPTVSEVPRRYPRDEMTRAWLERSGVGYVFMPRV
jgi:hypothetical protein